MLTTPAGCDAPPGRAGSPPFRPVSAYPGGPAQSALRQQVANHAQTVDKTDTGLEPLTRKNRANFSTFICCRLQLRRSGRRMRHARRCASHCRNGSAPSPTRFLVPDRTEETMKRKQLRRLLTGVLAAGLIALGLTPSPVPPRPPTGPTWRWARPPRRADRSAGTPPPTSPTGTRPRTGKARRTSSRRHSRSTSGTASPSTRWCSSCRRPGRRGRRRSASRAAPTGPPTARWPPRRHGRSRRAPPTP